MVDKNYEDTKFQGQECSALRDFRWLRIGDSAFTNLKTVRYECSDTIHSCFSLFCVILKSHWKVQLGLSVHKYIHKALTSVRERVVRR